VAVTTDATSKVHVLLLDGDALGVNCTQVGVLEETDDVGLRCLLQGLESLRLEPQRVIHRGGDATDETLERSTREQQRDRLLVLLDFAKSDSAGFVSPLLVGFLHATLSRGGLLDHVLSSDLSGHLGRGFGFSSSF